MNLAIVLLLACSTVLASAPQSPAPRVDRFELKANPIHVPVVAGTAIQIELERFDRFGALVVVEEERKDVAIVAWLVSYNAASKAPIAWARIKSIDEIAPDRIQSKANRITIDGSGDGDHRIAAHVTVPLGSTVRLVSGVKTAFDGSVGRGVVVQNSELVESRFGFLPNAAIMQAIETDKVSQ